MELETIENLAILHDVQTEERTTLEESSVEMDIETNSEGNEVSEITGEDKEKEVNATDVREEGPPAPNNESKTQCNSCNELAINKVYLEEKLSLCQMAYKQTKQNLENSDKKIAENAETINELEATKKGREESDRKLAESAVLIDELKSVIDALKSDDSSNTLGDKDSEIKALKDEIEALKQSGSESDTVQVKRLKFVCQKLEKEKNDQAEDHKQQIEDK